MGMHVCREFYLVKVFCTLLSIFLGLVTCLLSRTALGLLNLNKRICGIEVCSHTACSADGVCRAS